MATIKQITERVAAPFTGTKVNREQGYIDDVLICGFSSENGRDYPWGKVLKHKTGTYEGKVVNCDHGKEATIDRRLGWLSNESTGSDGRPRARLNILNSHPMANRVYEAAERNPSLFGLSHVAVCKMGYANGREIVEDIQTAISVDLVAEPATTHGLHESKGNTMPKTIKQLLEQIAAKSNVDQLLKLRRLTEMEGMGDLPVETASDVNPEDGITAAFRAACMSVIDDALKGDTDPKEALGKIKKLLLSHGDVNGDGTVNDKDVADLDKDKAEEAKKAGQGAAILEALDVAQKIKFAATKEDLQIIAATPVASRDAVAKRLKESTANTPAAGGPRSSPRQAIKESIDGNNVDPEVVKKPLVW